MAGKRVRTVAAAVLVLAAMAAFAWWRTRPVPLQDLVLYGNIDVRTVDLAFNDDGRIMTMQVDEGDVVHSGDLLATLDDSRYADAVTAARAEVGLREATLQELDRGSRPEEIDRARAEVASAAAARRDAGATAKRIEKLAAKGIVSPQEGDNARAAFLVAKGRVEAAEENLTLAVKGPRVEDIAAAKAQLEVAQAGLSLAFHRLADTKLFAPQDGIVLTRVREPGAVVLPNTPVYSAAISDPVWVRAYVGEPDLGRVRPGAVAAVITDSRRGVPYEGWVGFISPVAEFTPKSVETAELRTSLVYRVRVYVKNPDGDLRQGMPVTITLPSKGTASDGAAAPQQRQTE